VNTQLLVQGRKVLIATHKLSTQQIPLGHYSLDLLCGLPVLLLGIGKHAPELGVLARVCEREKRGE
jgi:hypothetical protein